MKFLICLLSLVMAVGSSLAKTILVPEEKSTIQAGINSASTLDTVLVADGTYAGSGNRDIDFKGKAIVVKSENGPEFTVIDCQHNGRGFHFKTNEDNMSVLEGFTIKNGNDSRGGAVLCEGASPTIQNNIITQNHAQNHGGGIACFNSSSPRIISNIIHQNSAAYQGGGIYCWDNSSPYISKNRISENSAQYTGGVRANTYCSPTLIYNVISENEGEYSGGGVSMGDDGILINNTIVKNIGGDGGVYCYGSVLMVNSIVRDNEPAQFAFNSGSLAAIYSNIQDGWTGTGNIDLDPLFVSPDNGNFNLQMDSPCVDKGVVSYSEGNTTLFTLSADDYDGTAPDMGALEYFRPVVYVSIPDFKSLPDEMLDVPVSVQFPEDYTCSSVELALSGFSGILDFLYVESTNSLAGDASWTYQYNETDNLLKIAMAGAENISGQGTLLWLKFYIPETASGFIPFVLDSVVFNTGQDARAELRSGSLTANYPPTISNLQNFEFCNTKTCRMNLDTCVTDLNDAPETMNWQVTVADGNIEVEITNRVAIFEAPDWCGTCAVQFIVNDPHGESDSLTVTATVSDPFDDDDTSINQADGKIPFHYELSQNHPNPFNPATTIPYQVAKATDVKISLYNVKGEKIAVLVDGKKQAGYHTVTWDASLCASGIYFIKMDTPEYSHMKRCMLVK